MAKNPKKKKSRGKRPDIIDKLALQTKVRREVSAQRSTGKSDPRSSPGVKARVRNLQRTGQEVPAITKGKPDKRNPLQRVSDKRKKRFTQKKKS